MISSNPFVIVVVMQSNLMISPFFMGLLFFFL